MNFGILVKSDKEKISSGSKLLPIKASINTLDSLIVLIPTLGVVHRVGHDLDFLISLYHRQL